MFDTLIRDIAVRFAIGESASRALLAILLDTLFDPRNGSLSGIAAQFRQRGLEGVFRSWIGDAPPRSIDPRQLEHVLGRDEIVAMAQGIGVASETFLAAATVMLPRLVRQMTPNGELPGHIPAGASGYLAEPARAVALHAIAADGAALGWLKWPLLAAVVLAFGYCMLNRDPGQAIASTTSAR